MAVYGCTIRILKFYVSWGWIYQVALWGRNDWQEIPRFVDTEVRQHLSRVKDKSFPQLWEFERFLSFASQTETSFSYLLFPILIAALEDTLEWYMSVICGRYYFILSKQAFASNSSELQLSYLLHPCHNPYKKCQFLPVLCSLSVKMEKKVRKESQEIQSCDFFFFYWRLLLKDR